MNAWLGQWKNSEECRRALLAGAKLLEHARESDEILASLGDAHKVLSDAEFYAYASMVIHLASLAGCD